ncbi:hypothetical protein BP6252_04085 [Coleophoma cylindrospora]|uniref:Uncharacterized protein n=1 Tax=Coleophoma cylindrospora TaxID=1849047 RepID=A0A3D8RZG5_9HELO|nr:hypothetical protein BP6252_04085 [Coleophoma cylindrospora]
MLFHTLAPVPLVLLGGFCAQSNAQESFRSGAQSTILNFTLYIDGGIERTNGTTPLPASSLTTIDLRNSFEVSSTYNASYQPKPSEVPTVSFGVLWGNNVDTFWLFGGADTAGKNNKSAIWQFETNGKGWTALDNTTTKLQSAMPRDGAGCSIPSWSVGYYLGGYISNDTTREYLHSMYKFDMDTKSTTIIEVPSFVPVVGQSLVYIDAGKKGVLVVLGGYTETNGVLELATLAEMFVYDIASKQWVVQTVTNTIGIPNDNGAGIPSARYNMCTVVGKSSDSTSYNIYVLGGQNETSTPSDIWVLTLPGAFWIQLESADATHVPRSSSSCTLINERFVLMTGGCWIAGNGSCLGSGPDPLLYNLNTAAWVTDFDVLVADYAVPSQIFNLIGGTAWGNATQLKPRLPIYWHTLLDKIFGPSDYNIDYYHQVLKVGLPCLLGLPIAYWFIEKMLGKLWKRNWKACTRRSHFLPVRISTSMLYRFVEKSILKIFQKSQKQNWKPWTLRPTFLFVLISTSMALMLTVGILLEISQTPAWDHSQWGGSLETGGLWSGTEWNTTYMPGPMHGRPPRGLLSFYVDTSSTGQWSLHNAAQRLGVANYFLWMYLPSIVTVFYGILWAVVDAEVKRIEPFRQLKRGSSVKDSIDLNYHSFWSPLAAYQAAARNQWTVLFSSIGSTLALIVLPNLQNYVFVTAIYSGDELEWGGQYSCQVLSLNPQYSKILLIVLGITTGCAVILCLLLLFQDTGLSKDPVGISSAASLVGYNRSSPLTPPGNSDWKKASEALSKLREDNHAIRIKTSGQDEFIEEMRTRPRKPIDWVSFLEKKLEPLAASIIFQKVLNTLLYPFRSLEKTPKRPFMLRPVPMSLWLVFLLTLMGLNVFILSQITSNHSMQYQDYHLPGGPNLYLVVGVFVQSIYQVLERTVRDTTTITRLSNLFCTPDVLFEDFKTSIPVIEIFQAFSKSYHLLGYVLFGSFCSIVYTIMLGSLQVSAGFYGATTFHADLDGVITVLVMNMVLFLVSAFVAYTYVWKDIMMKKGDNIGAPWEMGTLLSVIWLVGRSDDLKRDCTKGVDELRRKGYRYGFGRFLRNSAWQIGIERHFDDADKMRRFEELVSA